MKIGLICSRIRKEEKLLTKAFDKKNIAWDLLYIKEHTFNLNLKEQWTQYDLIFNRDISYVRALYTSQILEKRGVPVLNSSTVIKNCGDKIFTSLLLEKNQIPTPKVRVAFTPKSALEAMETLGYPVVIKPIVGSWGRLIAKINSPSSAEAILEHKKTLGTYHHSIYYLQEYIRKPGRDIRAFMIENEVICAIYRKSEHWITNTSRGGKASNCPLNSDLIEICQQTAQAVGGGILALDLFESKNGYVVNEINHSMEFRNSIKTTGVDIPKKIVQYLIAQKGK